MEARNPYVFVVGCRRSGTAVLQRMLDAHPQLAVARDTQFIPRVVEGAAAGAGVPLTPDVVERAIAYRTRSGRAGFQRLEVPEDTAGRLAERATTYERWVSLLFDEFASRRGKPLAGDRTPEYARSIAMLHELFPTARFVDVVRDGRDVALSLLRSEARGPTRHPIWKEEPVAACALWWADTVRAAQSDGARVGPDRYLRVGYEELVAQPEAVTIRVLEFLELPFASEMLQPPPEVGHGDWRKRMDRRELEIFESLAGDVLAGLGYERGLDAIAPERQAQAERWRRRWRKEYVPAERRPRGKDVTGSPANPHVFVVGCQRSGTTLLQKMLDVHPDLAVTCDSEFIPRVLAEAGAQEDVRLEPELVDLAVRYRSRSDRAGFKKLELPEATARGLAAQASTFGGFVSLLFDEVAARRGKTRAGDKTPDYALRMPLLHALFPWARFVHIVRDGRDVALSLRDWSVRGGPRGPARFEVWAEEPFAACALWWAGMVTTAERDGGGLAPGQYLLVRYEELVSDPEATLSRVTDFLGLPFASEMLLHRRPTAGRRDWRNQMERREVAVFESLAGDVLEMMGYERVTSAVAPELEERARDWRRRWESFAR
jgi:hypothetical protein